MPAVRQSAAPQPQQVDNGSQLPVCSIDDLATLSDDELKEVINGHHRAFMGCLGKAIKEHARLVGAALIEMKLRLKERLGHGHFDEWVREHFAGSERTARVYRQIADNWKAIELLGLDGEEATLEHLRSALAKAKKGFQPGFIFESEQQQEEFVELTRHLIEKVFLGGGTGETVLKALRFCKENYSA